MNEYCLDAERSMLLPFAIPGDNGMAYLEWGAVPGCLRGEVTGLCVPPAGSSLAQCLMPVGRHFLAGKGALPPPLPPPPPLRPPGLASLSGLRSHPRIGMPVGQPGASQRPGPRTTSPTAESGETKLLSSPSPPPPLEVPGPALGGRPTGPLTR